MDTTIGEKVRHLRTTKGFSQLDLETEINASPGSISRIENGKVNPTKETLYAIAQALSLSVMESSYLFGLGSDIPSQADAQNTIANLQTLLTKPDKFALLIDNTWTLKAASKAFYDQLDISTEHKQALINQHLLAIMFSPESPASNVFDASPEFLTYEVAMFKSTVLQNPTTKERVQKIIDQLQSIPVFAKIWNEADKVDLEYYPAEMRNIRFKLVNGWQDFRINFQYLNSDPRFELLDYEKI